MFVGNLAQVVGLAPRRPDINCPSLFESSPWHLGALAVANVPILNKESSKTDSR